MTTPPDLVKSYKDDCTAHAVASDWRASGRIEKVHARGRVVSIWFTARARATGWCR